MNEESKGGLTELQKSFREAMKFNVSNVREMNSLSEDEVRKRVEEEVASGRVDVLDNGMTVGMSAVVTEPVHHISGIWNNLRNRFTAALQPYMADITAVDALYEDVEKTKKKRDEKLKSLDDMEAMNPKKENIFENYKRSKSRYDEFRNKYRNRDAVMFSKSFVYWVVLFLILLTEGFINYHAFEKFWGLPAVALGTTIILGVLLALSAHQHGELIKQWPCRFARSKPVAEKASSWRMLGMATVALTIVLLFTGWSRWAVALSSIQSQGTPSDNMVGSVGFVQVNPIRDVMISLIANVGVWILGVIISYIGHDRDPDYMDTTKQFNTHRKSWEKLRKRLQEEREQVEAAAREEIEAKENAAETRLKDVKDQYDMKVQMEERNKLIREEIHNVAQNNVLLYKRKLINLSKEKDVTISFFEEKTGKSLSSAYFDQLSISFSA